MIRKLRLLLALAVSACVETGPAADAPAATDILTGNTFAEDRISFGKVDPAYPRAGVTYASEDGFGLRVEHYEADGKVHLWYPGATKTVVGEWKREEDDVCLRQPGYGYANRPDGWRCGDPSALARDVVALVEGDPYGLVGGRVPAHDLRTCKLPPGMLLKKSLTCLPGL